MFAERSSFLVSLEDDGVIGRGEATPLPEMGGETALECAAALSNALPVKMPGAPADVEAALAHVTAPAARFALETALLDVIAQKRGVPLGELLRAGASRLVSVNAVVDSAPDAERCVEEGFRTLKLKVGADLQDVQRVHDVARAVGANVSIRIDANGAWTEGAAIEMLSLLRDIELCEQPVMDSAALARIVRRELCPIAVDEGLREWLEVTDRPHAIAVLKPALIGGLRRCLAIAELGIGCFVTCGYEGPIGRAAAVHLAAALPAQRYAHGLAMGRFFDDPPSPLDPAGGAIRIPGVPGLGA